MSVIEIKGIEIGTGVPKTIVPIMGTDFASIADDAREAVAAGADCIEWRADYCPAVQSGSFAEAFDFVKEAAGLLDDVCKTTPLIFTVRTLSQGGQADITAANYEALLSAVIETGLIDIVDVELNMGEQVVACLMEYSHRHCVAAIVSLHDFEKTPDTPWMVDTLTRMHELGADIPKLAVMAQCKQDTLRLLSATEEASRKLDSPLVTMAMGEHGAPSRLCGETFGSSMTFCSLEAASAPGQMSLQQTKAVLEAIHAALA